MPREGDRRHFAGTRHVIFNFGFARRAKRVQREISISEFLAAAVLALSETFPAVDGTVPAGLERNFAFFFTFRASRLEHFSRPAAESTTTATLLKCHTSSFIGLTTLTPYGKRLPPRERKRRGPTLITRRAAALRTGKDSFGNSGCSETGSGILIKRSMARTSPS